MGRSWAVCYSTGTKQSGVLAIQVVPYPVDGCGLTNGTMPAQDNQS